MSLRIGIRSLSVGAAILWLASLGSVASQEIEILDPRLEGAIRTVLEIPDGPLTAEDLARLTELSVANGGIAELTGLEFATNLTELDISNNPLDRVSLRSVSLRTLKAVGLGLHDFDLDLPNIESLDLSDNVLEGFSGHFGLSQLRELRLARNLLCNLEGFEAFTLLEVLDISHNAISRTNPPKSSTQVTVNKGVEPLANLRNLRTLGLAGNGITELELESLQNLSALASLDLSDTAVRTISALGGMGALEEVALVGTFLDFSKGTAAADVVESLEQRGVAVTTGRPRPMVEIDISDPQLERALRRQLKTSERSLTTRDMAELTTVVISDLHITDLTGLGHAFNMKSLHADETSVRTLEPLTGATSLVFLDVSESLLRSLAGLAGLAHLRTLRLDDNRITDVTPLAGLPRLKRLNILINKVGDLEPLRGLGLRSIAFGRNPVTDISVLATMTHLRSVGADSIGIRSIEPLRNLALLSSARLDGNRIEDISPLRGKSERGGGWFQVSDNFLDLRPGSEASATVSELEQAGNTVLATPQLSRDGVYVPATLSPNRQIPAFELRWPARSSARYRVEFSEDLRNWFPDGPAYDGGVRSMAMFHLHDHATLYFRVLEFSL